METSTFYYIASVVATIIALFVAWGKFRADLEKKELRIAALEKNDTKGDWLIEKLFNKIEDVQRDVTAIRLELKDKQNRD